MIYYFPGADHAIPSGGVRTHYDHVEHLVSLGYDATILHVQPGFRPPWFQSTAPVTYIQDAELGPNDVLVLNEIMGPATDQIAPGVRKVIFCQNSHYNFRHWPIPPQNAAPQAHPEVIATLVLTEYERAVFNWAFPGHPVHVTPHGYDFSKFDVGVEKKRQIAFMPRKHVDEAQQVFGWLGVTGRLKGWDVVVIDGKSEDETAQILRESMVFAAFGHPEGGTKPPFEALAAGCVVVGYGGFASDDDLNEMGGYVVPSGNTCYFAQGLGAVCERDMAELIEVGRENSALVQHTFTKERERKCIQRAWTSILSPAS